MIQGDSKDKELNMEINTRLSKEHFLFFCRKNKNTCHASLECWVRLCEDLLDPPLEEPPSVFLLDLRRSEGRTDDFKVQGSWSFPLKFFWQHQQFPFYVLEKPAESSINSTIKQHTFQVRDAQKETWHTQLALLSTYWEDWVRANDYKPPIICMLSSTRSTSTWNTTLLG